MTKIQIPSSKFQTPLTVGRKLFGNLEIELYDIKGHDRYDINSIVFIDLDDERTELPFNLLHFFGYSEMPDVVNEACSAHVASLLEPELDATTDNEQDNHNVLVTIVDGNIQRRA